jgi:hypothetical protein
MSSTIQRTKAQAIFFLLGAVLVGGALGFTANRAIERRDMLPKDQRSSRTQLADRLQLDNAQRRMIDSVLDRRNEEMKVLLEPVRPRLDSVRFAARAVIRARLTPAQQAAWDEMLVELAKDSLRNQRR